MSQKIALGYLRAKLNLLGVVSKRKAAAEAIILFSTPFRKVKKKVPPIFEKAEEIHFSMHHKKVYGYRWNHPSSHRFLILHGFESSAYNFDRYVKPMIKKGYEVVAMDAPAHGRSEGKTINLLEYVDMVRETWKRFGPFDAVLAHSFGGLAISLYLDEHPPEHSPQIALIAPATETTTAVNSFFKVLQMNDEIKQEFNRQIHQKTGRWPAEYSITRVAPTLKADILWAHDEEDNMTPLADTEKIRAQNLPHIRFLITKGLGHRRIYRDNHVSRAILDFFETHTSPEDLSRP
ncbi:MAG: lysophospholipase [Chitinophagaceae bacterium]|nr:lysophospholipase [Chitinophagaceae bacterium]